MKWHVHSIQCMSLSYELCSSSNIYIYIYIDILYIIYIYNKKF